MKKVRRPEDFLIKLMRITFIQCMLAGLFAGITWANDGRAQSALSQKVTVDIRNEEIKTIFAQLEKQTNARFIFSSKLIQSDRRASVKVKNGSLSAVLDALLKPLELHYRIKDDLIVIKPDHPGLESEPVSEEVPVVEITAAAVVDKAISGVVKDETGTGLPGVSVVLKGTQTGTLTDEKGKYSVTVPNGDHTLIFSFVGFLSQEIVVPSGQNALDITLKVDNKALEEVIVVGYGTQKKESLTGSIATVTAKDIERVHGGSTVSSGLAGKIPGVTFRMPDGRPGASANIQIRNMGNRCLSSTASSRMRGNSIIFLPTILRAFRY